MAWRPNKPYAPIWPGAKRIIWGLRAQQVRPDDNTAPASAERPPRGGRSALSAYGIGLHQPGRGRGVQQAVGVARRCGQASGGPFGLFVDDMAASPQIGDDLGPERGFHCQMTRLAVARIERRRKMLRMRHGLVD